MLKKKSDELNAVINDLETARKDCTTVLNLLKDAARRVVNSPEHPMLTPPAPGSTTGILDIINNANAALENANTTYNILFDIASKLLEDLEALNNLALNSSRCTLLDQCTSAAKEWVKNNPVDPLGNQRVDTDCVDHDKNPYAWSGRERVPSCAGVSTRGTPDDTQHCGKYYEITRNGDGQTDGTAKRCILNSTSGYCKTDPFDDHFVLCELTK